MKEVQVYSSWEEYIDSKIKFYAPHDFDVEVEMLNGQPVDEYRSGCTNLKKHLDLIGCKRCVIHFVVSSRGAYWWYEDKDVLIEADDQQYWDPTGMFVPGKSLVVFSWEA